MARSVSGALGIGLIFLGLSESNYRAASWVMGLSFLAAILAFGIAGGITRRSSHGVRVGSPIGLSILLFFLAVLSYGTSTATPFQIGWTFGFALAFLILGLAATDSGAHYAGRLGTYGYGPYDFNASGVYPPGFPWRPYVPMGGYDELQNPVGYTGRGPRNYQRSDSRIHEDINDRLTHHWKVDATDIVVQVKNQDVVLQGRVTSRSARRIAEDIADSVLGVKEVKNELQVKKDFSSSVRVA